jgi:8-oxo-dGTP pyrophosphatase MutT (NUDIX family)
MTLLEKLLIYRSKNSSEKSKVDKCLQLLEAGQGCFTRDTDPGHFTGSAWIVNTGITKTLLVRHRKLGKWVQPGGHADGEQNLYVVARRELKEETGLDGMPGQRDDIFDIDIHFIPAAKGEDEHYHFDVRFLFLARESLAILVSEESHDIGWIELDHLEEYTGEESILRMRKKCLQSQ